MACHGCGVVVRRLHVQLGVDVPHAKPSARAKTNKLWQSKRNLGCAARAFAFNLLDVAHLKFHLAQISC